MPPSESDLLSNFLLPPAPLHQVLTQQEFTALFPRAYQSSPQVKALYRDFQYQRAADADVVKKNIEAEVKRGQRQRRRIAQARRNRDGQAIDESAMTDVALEAELFGERVKNPISGTHTVSSLQAAMEEACGSLEMEINALEEELQKKLEMAQAAVGELSDLRYGKFAKGPAGADDLGQQVLENLQRLEAICRDTGNST